MRNFSPVHRVEGGRGGGPSITERAAMGFRFYDADYVVYVSRGEGDRSAEMMVFRCRSRLSRCRVPWLRRGEQSYVVDSREGYRFVEK